MSKPDRPITEHISKDRQTLSVEFSPPRTEEAGVQILKTASILREKIRPDFVSITYGAGGSTRERTQEYAKLLSENYDYDVVAHLTCVGSSKDELREIIRSYRKNGLMNIMALRGDPPKGQSDFHPHPDGLAHASELVALIRETEPDFCIGVAGYPEKHPQAATLDEDIANLKLKVDAGASFVTTQLFFDNRFFFDFVNRCSKAGIAAPIIPGLMPALSYEQVLRFGKMNGSAVPEELEKRLFAVKNDPDAQRAVGVEWTFRQVADLFNNGINMFHLYIMNRSESALGLVEKLTASGYLKR
jgi:methylenetetrahydrofolate reductase (NADPH)